MYSEINRYCLWPLLNRRRGSVSVDHARKLARSQYDSAQAIEEYQLGRIRALSGYAYDHSPFYRKRFEEAGLHPRDIRTAEDFGRLPLLTREEINEHAEEMIADSRSREDIHYDQTGGSTGLPTRFARSNSCLPAKGAVEERFNTFAGWRRGEKIAFYWPAIQDVKPGNSGRRGYLVDKYIKRRLLLYAGKLNERVLAGHVDILRRFRPDLLRAFPNSLHVLAEHCRSNGVTLPVKRGIITVGEPLLENDRELFREVFSCAVFNCYVSRETGNIACECREHDGLHVADEALYLEVVNKDRNGVGEIVLTDFLNDGMPLLRYRIQDACRELEGPCRCGRGLKRILLDSARLSDYFISPVDRTYVSGSSIVHYLFAESRQRARMQVIQEELDRIVVKIAGTEAEYGDYAAEVKRRINELFKCTMRIDVRFVDEIPFLPSGKYMFAYRKCASGHE